MRQKYVFALVTNDKYEFPLTAYMSAKELADITGLKETSIRFYSSPAHRQRVERRKPGDVRKNYKIVALLYEDLMAEDD